MSTKFFNPLFDTQEAEQQSVSSEQDDEVAHSSSAAFQVDTPDICPKCKGTNIPAKLLSDEVVMFCPTCRVSLAIPE